jgi:hypothetical protein
MEEDESTNQNPVKKAGFLWITGHSHFGNGERNVPLVFDNGRKCALYARHILRKKIRGLDGPGNFVIVTQTLLLDVQSNVINHE